MTEPEPDAIPGYADRVIRESLEDVDNLRELLHSALGAAADSLDVAKRKILPRDFLLPNWQGRERDFLCEIPYRLPDGERTALVAVLIEHQTRPSSLLPIRMLIYAVFYWEKCLRAWEAAPAPRQPFRLPPIIPMVFHASPRSWTGARTLADLLDAPAEFHAFAPVWKPIFWEVGNHSADELLQSEEAFLQVLAIVRAEDAERDEAVRVYRELLAKLAKGREQNPARWTHLLRFALGWVANRRPLNERKDWSQITEDHQNNEFMKQEIRDMGKTIAQGWVEEGIEIGIERGIEKGIEKGIERGIEKGIEKGRLLGLLDKSRSNIERLGRRRLGEPNPEILELLHTIDDMSRLDWLFDRVQDVSTWDELFAPDKLNS